MNPLMRKLGMLLVLLALAACRDPISLDWKVKLGGSSQSNPLVTDRYIAVGSEVGLTIVNRDGTIKCTYPAHGEIISAPKKSGARIFFGSTNYNFYAITSDCEELWKFAARDRIKSDPLVEDSRVYLSSYDGHVYALNAEDGRVDWVFPESGRSVTYYPGGEPVAPEDADEAALAATAALAEQAPKEILEVGDFSYSSPILHEGMLYVGNMDGRLYALDAATGVLRWYYTTSGPLTSTPLIDGNLMFFGSNDARMHGIDLRSRKNVWTVVTKDWVLSSPRIDNGLVFFGSNDRRVFAVEADNGAQIWTSSVSTAEVVSSPTPYQDVVIFGGGSGDNHIYAINKETGEPFWKYETGGKIYADPVIKDKKLFVASTDGHLYAFSLRKTKIKN